MKGTALLYNKGLYTIFSYEDMQIKFRTSPMLKKYVKIKEWDNGYLVVDADYTTLGVTEEYIDINDILDGLYIDEEEFLSPIKEVKLAYD